MGEQPGALSIKRLAPKLPYVHPSIRNQSKML